MGDRELWGQGTVADRELWEPGTVGTGNCGGQGIVGDRVLWGQGTVGTGNWTCSCLITSREKEEGLSGLLMSRLCPSERESGMLISPHSPTGCWEGGYISHGGKLSDHNFIQN